MNMHRTSLIVAAVSITLPLLAVDNTAKAWGNLAHTAICEIAFQELEKPARDEVKRLIRKDPDYRFFAESCTWPDAFPRKRSKEHFVNLERDAEEISGQHKCPLGSKCVVTAIESDFAKLANPNSTDAEKLAALKFLGHWVGDIHQPLHVSFRDDKGGNDIKENGPCRGSLHSVWDTCIFEERFGSDPFEIGLDFQNSVDDDERAQWLGTMAPVDWANESFEITIRESVGYCVMTDSGCSYESGNLELDGDEDVKVVVVKSDYLTLHAPTVEERIKMAGVRLGAMINQALGNN